MNRIAGLVIAGLILMVGVTPTWGGPPNPTASDGNGNTAGGTGALEAVTSDALSNTAFGANALAGNTTGEGNTASGYSALARNNTGNFNTACGHAALFSNTTGGLNTACGGGALQNNTTGSLNTAHGAGALAGNTIGGYNTASGNEALVNNTTGNFNTASGFLALESNTTGSRNTAIGWLALRNSTGNQNIAVGPLAGSALTGGNKNIYLGHPGAVSESKTMRLGSVQAKTFIAGVTTAAVSGTNVVINADGQLGTLLSSARYKRDIETMGARSEGLLNLRPVTFVYKRDGQGTRQYGLIAEEVATVYPELVTHAATGEVQGVRYQELIPLLLNELQRQQRELAELRILVGELRGSSVAQR